MFDRRYAVFFGVLGSFNLDFIRDKADTPVSKCIVLVDREETLTDP